MGRYLVGQELGEALEVGWDVVLSLPEPVSDMHDMVSRHSRLINYWVSHKLSELDILCDRRRSRCATENV